ncbi:MAG TPA: DUF4175 family protein [Ignavibacteriaceae bacterium]|nr:DUF4175 family protein [Ignavibacteriaceae bacterium]
MGTESKYYLELLKKLEGFIRKDYLQFLLFGIQAFVAAVLLNFTFYSFLELIANFNSTIRTVLFILFIVLALGLLFFFLVKPILKYIGSIRKEVYFDAAVKVGTNFPEVKDELLNSMQLISENEKVNLYSSNLIEASFKKVYERVKDLNFQSIINFSRAKKILPYFTAITVICITLILFVPGLTEASYRMINFNQEFVPPPKFIFEITPGNKEITKGDGIDISIKVKGSKPKTVYLASRKEAEADFQKQELLPDSSGNYFLKINSVKSSFRYFAEADGFQSEYFEIRVIDRPIVRTLEVEIISPSYSRIPKAVQKDNGNIQALIGSKVSFNISSTKKIKEAKLEFADSPIVNLNVNGEFASGSFSVRKDNSYKIQLIDENGNENLAPINYQVKALYDAFPVIELLSPNQNTMLANDNRVSLVAKTSDDYGFSKLMLNYRLSASRYEQPQTEFSSIEIPIEKSQLEININYIWNLTQMYLAVDDVVTYYLEIFDNDNVSGPKSARTQTLTVRVPSLDEILNNADQMQVQSEAELEQVLKDAEDLKKVLDEIDKELKKDEEKLSWEEKQKIENALEKFQELQDKVDKVNDQLGDMKQNLQENNLLSKETMEKYMELQKLMDEMTSDEMKKAMEKLQNVLKDMNRNMTQEQLQNLKMDEERFKKSIERTLNLLKRIQVEQKMDELLKRTEEMTEKQENLSEQTEQSDPSNQKENENLSKKQDEITKDLEKLKKEMQDLEKKMSEIPDMPQEEMEKLMEEFDQQQNQQLSEQASQDMKQNQSQKACKNQQQLSKNMKQMQQMMQQMKDSMQQQNQMQTFTDMMKILDNIISLSKQQEDLKRESESLEPNSSMLDELAKKENNLSNNLNNLMQQMSDLSQKTFAITPEMGKSLGDAKKQMDGSVQSMKNRNGMLAGNQQGEAMKSLNEAAMMMKSSMESMMQGGSGQGGMMSLMQQLQQMSGDQMNLNNLTQKLQQMQQGGLNPQQQLEMQRLGQQQQLIQKSLEQLNQEAKVSGQSTKLPADLDNILKKMQEVITDMRGEKLDDNLIQKQENILSKLLDAQRSINERDYEKERESRTGETISRNLPPELNLSSTNSMNKIRDELNKAVKEGYSRDYEDLIRKYYEILQNESLQNQ